MGRHTSLLFISILLSLAMVFWGCGSTPEAEAPGPAESASEAAVDAEAAALAAENARLMAELSAAKEAAQVAGAEGRFPEEFAEISAEYDALVKAQKESPSQDNRVKIEALRDAYLAMAKLSQAESIRERLVTAGLEDSDPATFQKGDAALAGAKRLLKDGVYDADLAEQSSIAYESFAAILAANFTTMCQSQREAALAAKERADSVKSAQAAKDAYAAAELAFSGADAAYNGKSYEVAYEGFVAAASQFTAVYEDVSVRRAAAEEAIRRAKEKVGASAALAAEADGIAPLGDAGQEAEQ